MTDLSRIARRIRAGTGMSSMIRSLDDDGKFDTLAAMQVTPQGQVLVPTPKREDYVDAEELVEMIRKVIREELDARLAITHREG